MFRKKLEAEAAKELPQLSKQAHQAFKYVTGSASKGDGLGDMATWTTGAPSGTTVARGHKEVGDMVSSYTRTTSSAATAEGEFCEDFRASISAAVAQLNLDDRDFMANAASSDHPIEEKVGEALKGLATRPHKSPGLDWVHAWMVVCGGQAVKGALVAMALYQNVWSSGRLPKAWHEARISYLHKKGSKTVVSNYRPISLISVMAKTFTRSWVG